LFRDDDYWPKTHWDNERKKKPGIEKMCADMPINRHWELTNSGLARGEKQPNPSGL
jgi:hypothetical protein